MDVALVLFDNLQPDGDIHDLFRRLHRCSKLRKFHHLALFLDDAVAVLKQQVEALPRNLRETVPFFHDFPSLTGNSTELSAGPLGSVWEMVFNCIHQIATFIGHFEARQIPFDLPASATLSGLTSGLFSAAAVAVSSSLLDMAKYGAESVRAVFAYALQTATISRLVEPYSWVEVVEDVPAEIFQAELDAFDCHAAPLVKLSMGHMGDSRMIFRGPLSRLRELFDKSEVLKRSQHSELHVLKGIHHVSHTDALRNLRLAFEDIGVAGCWEGKHVRLQLLSPRTGKIYPANDGARLLACIVTDAMASVYISKLVSEAFERINLVETTWQILYHGKGYLYKNITAELPLRARSWQKDLTDWVYEDGLLDDKIRSFRDSKIAIVGMACRLPGADTPERFWDLLMAGRDMCTTVPPDRFDVEAHYDAMGKKNNSVTTRFGNFVENPGHFDAGFFNMSPREAEQTDPSQRLSLVTAYEALESAGFVVNRTPSSHASRVGTYIGQIGDDYREVNANQNIGTYGTSGTVRAFGPGRINYLLGFGGPAVSIDTACSSGLATVQAACAALWAGEVDTAVAGGASIMTNPDIYAMLGRGHFLSATGPCRVFDKTADGYCRGDGVGAVVLKRLADAEADNDVILGTVVAAATNHCPEAVSLTHPHAGAQMDNYRRVMQMAGVSPLDVSYVEMHGTGTQAGDAVEPESVANVFAPTTRTTRLRVGAVKANVGHGEAAAGITSLIKTLLMYRHSVVPRHIGIRSAMNPAVERSFQDRNIGVCLEHTRWPKNGTRHVVVNSFGAHGGNTTMLLQDAPTPTPAPETRSDDASSEADYMPVCVSAKSRVSLEGNIKSLLRYLKDNPDTGLKDVAYTTCVRRLHHSMRLSISVKSTAELTTSLQAAIDDMDGSVKNIPATPPQVVFVFSGQGSLKEGAAAYMFKSCPFFQKQLLQLDRIVTLQGFPSVLAAIVGPEDKYPSRDMDCAKNTPIVMQLALLILEVALTRYWLQLGIAPSVVIGHSLGEYAALVAAGVLSVADAIFLVGKRAELLLERCQQHSHGMLSLRGLSQEQITRLSGDCPYEVSCINGHTDIVISGKRSHMAYFDLPPSWGGFETCSLIDLPFAFHSSQLDPILDDFENLARCVTFHEPQIPILSPLLGQVIDSQSKLGCDKTTVPISIDATYLRRATREPVDFVAALSAANLASDKAAWLEIGPHRICTSFVRNTIPNAQTFVSMRQGEETLSSLTRSLAGLYKLGLPVAWNEYFALDERNCRLLPLDTYHWKNHNYWIPYRGTWTLHKGRPEEPQRKEGKKELLSSSIQCIVAEEIGESTASITAISDLAHPTLAAMVRGHKVNGRGVLSGSAFAEMALTIGQHLYSLLNPDASPDMNICDMDVEEAQILHEDSKPQPIRITANLDMLCKRTQISWFTTNANGAPSPKPFATAAIHYENAQTWKRDWHKTARNITARAETLWTEASLGNNVSKLAQRAIYVLYSTIVDYETQYQAMHSLVLAENTMEASAEVILPEDESGTWYTPPHWIDGAFQIAGFVMNAFGGPDLDQGTERGAFYLAPGWTELKMTERLKPGRYRNYVRMLPVQDQPGMFTGDIYLVQGEDIVGACEGMRFKRIARSLCPLIFPTRQDPCPSDASSFSSDPITPIATPSVTASAPSIASDDYRMTPTLQTPRAHPQDKSLLTGLIRLMARETGLEVGEIGSDSVFVQLGVDSLMALVLAEAMHSELGVRVNASTFLQCETVQQLVDWVETH